jgi:hypothetical protein
MLPVAVIISLVLGRQTPLPETGSLDEKLVYTAVVSMLGQEPSDTLLVGDSSIVFTIPPELVPSSWWNKKVDSLPEKLVAELVIKSKIKRASGKMSLPPPFKVVIGPSLDDLWRLNTEAGWRTFKERYPRNTKVVYFSPVAFSTDSSEALVYLRYHCGPLCGELILVWLKRDDTGNWRAKNRVQLLTA